MIVSVSPASRLSPNVTVASVFPSYVLEAALAVIVNDAGLIVSVPAVYVKS